MINRDQTGDVVFSSRYKPFGSAFNTIGTEEFKYAGKHEDTTGLYYYGAGYYDPTTGRFTTEDPIRGRLTDPQTLNRYIYCRNNPLKYTDPDGRFLEVLGIAAPALGSLGPAGWAALGVIALGVIALEVYMITSQLPTGVITTPTTPPSVTTSEQYDVITIDPQEQIENSSGQITLSTDEQHVKLHEGRQGKHQIGHPNYLEGRSILTNPKPQKLLDRYAGTGQPLNDIP